MSDRGPLFQSGDRVVTCGEARRKHGEIVYRSGDCPVHGDPLYLVAFKRRDGREVRLDICESVLALPNEARGKFG